MRSKEVKDEYGCAKDPSISPCGSECYITGRIQCEVLTTLPILLIQEKQNGNVVSTSH